MSNSLDPGETAHMSRLFWICAVCKSQLLSPVACSETVKALSMCLRPKRRFVCAEVLRPSQPNGVMSSAVSLPNHTFTGYA